MRFLRGRGGGALKYKKDLGSCALVAGRPCAEDVPENTSHSSVPGCCVPSAPRTRRRGARFLKHAPGRECDPEWGGVEAEPALRPGRCLTPALTRPQRPCPARAASPPPPGAERKGRRSPRTAPAATRSPSRRPAVRGARPLMPQVSSARGAPTGARPDSDWPGVFGLSQRGCKGDVRDRLWVPAGQLQKAVFRDGTVQCQCNGTGAEGASKWLRLWTTFLFVALGFPRKSPGSANSRWAFFFSRRNQCTVLIKWKVA